MCDKHSIMLTIGNNWRAIQDGQVVVICDSGMPKYHTMAMAKRIIQHVPDIRTILSEPIACMLLFGRDYRNALLRQTQCC